METPSPTDLPERDPPAEPPDFDALTDPSDLVSGDRTREDFFDAVLGLTEPGTVGDIAERAGHGVDAAREYLDWFERMGIVERVTDSPATYRRNREYLAWRRVQQLRAEYGEAELVEQLSEATDRERSIAEQFDADAPRAVSISEVAAATDRPIEDVWSNVSEWRTLRREIDLLERALSGSETGDLEDRRRVA